MDPQALAEVNSASPPGPSAALDEYRSYLEGRAATLVTSVSRTAFKIKINYLGSAQSRYVYARVSLGQLEPVAATLAGLHLRIEGPGGFRRIEKALWSEETTAGMLPVAKRLIHDVKELQRKLATVELRPSALANDAASTLNEIVVSKLRGKGAPYSHTGLVDISANVEGAEAAFKAIKPLLEKKAAKLVDEIESRFESVFAELRKYGHPARDPEHPFPSEPGISFTSYEPTAAEIRERAPPFKQLAELLSQVPAQISTASSESAADHSASPR